MKIYKNKIFLFINFIFLVFNFLIFICFAQANVTPRISSLKYWTGSESTQIAIYFQGRVDYSVTDLPNKTGFLFHARNAAYQPGDTVMQVRDGVVDRIEIRNNGNSSRIFVYFMSTTGYRIAPEHRDRNFPLIEIDRPLNLRPVQPTPEHIAAIRENHKIIMIDPGHGGWHYGARANNLIEKDVVMEMGIELQRRINSMPGFIAFLTRNPNFNNGDYFVSLGRRREIAAKYNADLFVSLHLNAPGTQSRGEVRGTEIFHLAYGDASDAEAQQLADLENAADLEFAGDNKQNNMTDILTQLLLDERMIALNNQSSLLAGLVLDNMLRIDGLSNRGVKHARFAVLKNPMPSILIEVIFVTSPTEARIIQQPGFNSKMANKIAEAIERYYSINRGRFARPEYNEPAATIKEGS